MLELYFFCYAELLNIKWEVKLFTCYWGILLKNREWQKWDDFFFFFYCLNVTLFKCMTRKGAVWAQKFKCFVQLWVQFNAVTQTMQPKHKTFSSIHTSPAQPLTFLSTPSQCCFLSLFWSWPPESLSLPSHTLFWFPKDTQNKVPQIILCYLHLWHSVLLATWTSIVRFGQVSFSQYEVRPVVDFLWDLEHRWLFWDVTLPNFFFFFFFLTHQRGIFPHDR